MKKIVFVITTLLATLQLNAQTPPKDSARFLTQFKFTKYLTGIILIQAQMDDHSDTLSFILDTGSNGISIDSATCEKLMLPNRLTDTFVSGIGGKRQVRFTFNRSLKMGGISIDSLQFHINDYSFLTRVSGQRIDGVIGSSFLNRFIIMVDYENCIIQLYSPGIIQYPKKGYTFKPKIKPLPTLKATINDSSKFDGSFYFDSGAKMELIVSKRFADEKKLFRSKRKMSLISVEGVAGGEYMPVSIISEMKFGPYKFKNVPTYVYNDVNNITVYPLNYGLIGSGIFSKFNLIFNFPAGEIYMKPNKHFNESFDYSYTGLSLFEEEQRILIYDIAPESPAQIAGLEVDDEIISVDDVFYNNVDDCREAIGKRNTYIRLTIKRGEKMENVLMKTGSII